MWRCVREVHAVVERAARKEQSLQFELRKPHPSRPPPKPPIPSTHPLHQPLRWVRSAQMKREPDVTQLPKMRWLQRSVSSVPLQWQSLIADSNWNSASDSIRDSM